MKEINFRPLRRIKKTGIISTPDYMGWSKVRTANYNEFKLTVDVEYREVPDNEYVYNYKGELLYFYTYKPNDIPIFNYPFNLSIEEIFAITTVRGLDWGDNISYSGKGIDCNGTPTFSHFTADYIGNPGYGITNIDEFEPLTAGLVKEWYLWFLLRLSKACISQKSHKA